MKLEALSRKLILIIGAAAVLLMVGAAAYYRSLSCLPFIWGVMLGTMVSLLKVFMLQRAIDQSLSKTKSRATIYIQLQHMLQLALTGVALLVAAVVPGISLWGTAAGVMTQVIGLYLVQIAAKP